MANEKFKISHSSIDIAMLKRVYTSKQFLYLFKILIIVSIIGWLLVLATYDIGIGGLFFCIIIIIDVIGIGIFISPIIIGVIIPLCILIVDVIQKILEMAFFIIKSIFSSIAVFITSEWLENID